MGNKQCPAGHYFLAVAVCAACEMKCVTYINACKKDEARVFAAVCKYIEKGYKVKKEAVEMSSPKKFIKLSGEGEFMGYCNRNEMEKDKSNGSFVEIGREYEIVYSLEKIPHDEIESFTIRMRDGDENGVDSDMPTPSAAKHYLFGADKLAVLVQSFISNPRIGDRLVMIKNVFKKQLLVKESRVAMKPRRSKKGGK
jgi:hypothetical protein